MSNSYPFMMGTITPELLAHHPGGILTQESRSTFYEYEGLVNQYRDVALFGVVDPEMTPLECYLMVSELNNYFTTHICPEASFSYT